MIYILDSTSFENVLSKSTLEKLGLSTEKYPKPYKLAWLKKNIDVIVSHRVLVSFSVGQTYTNDINCHVFPMDAFRILLRRTWKFDLETIHNDRDNTYSLLFL